MTKKLLALLFAGLLTLGGAACTVDAEDDAEGGGTVEVEEETEVQVEEETS